MKRMKFLQHLCINISSSMWQGDNYNPTESLNTAQKLACDHGSSASQTIWLTLKIQWYQVIVQQFTKKKQNKSGMDCQRSLFQAKRLKSTQSFSVARSQLGDPSRKPRRRRLRGVATKVLNAFPRNQLFQDIWTLLRGARSMQAAERKVWGNTCHFGEEHKVWT